MPPTSIDSATGRLSTKSGIGDGKGSGSTYEIAITATDAAGLEVTSTFTLTQGGVYIVRAGEADIPANQLMSGAEVLPENQAGSTSNPIAYIKDSSGAEIRNILATGMPFNVSENATGDAWNVFYTGNALDHETATTTSWRLSIVYESNNVTSLTLRCRMSLMSLWASSLKKGLSPLTQKKRLRLIP